MSTSESIDNHDTEPCLVSPRSVDAAIGELDEFVDQLCNSGFAAADVAVALLCMSVTVASRYGAALGCYERHREILIESGSAFVCAKCGNLTDSEEGAADDQPDVCDDCYSSTDRNCPSSESSDASTADVGAAQ